MSNGRSVIYVFSRRNMSSVVNTKLTCVGSHVLLVNINNTYVGSRVLLVNITKANQGFNVVLK